MDEWHCTVGSINRCLQASPLFINASGRNLKFKPNAVLSILLFFCLWGGSLTLGRCIAVPVVESLPRDSTLAASLALSLRKILVCGFQILAFFAWVKFVEKRKIAAIGFMGRHRARAYWGGFLLGCGSIAAILLTLYILGAATFTFNALHPLKILIGCLCIAVFGWGIQSASEEIAIRGWLIPTLGTRYTPLAAILLTGGVFGGIHLLGNGATVLSFINLTLSGFFFALYAIDAGHIWGVCGLHLGWNFAQGALFGLNISGEPSAGRSLFITNCTGADVWTGGTFGPEGGLVTTVFLACAVLLMGRILYQKHKASIRAV